MQYTIPVDVFDKDPKVRKTVYDLLIREKREADIFMDWVKFIAAKNGGVNLVMITVTYKGKAQSVFIGNHPLLSETAKVPMDWLYNYAATRRLILSTAQSDMLQKWPYLANSADSFLNGYDPIRKPSVRNRLIRALKRIFG